MKNLLSENMLRFGTKNLSESIKKELILKSVMETINEHGLHNAVKRQLRGVNEAVTGQPDASLSLVKGGVTVPARTLCNGLDYVSLSVQIANKSMQEAYISRVDFYNEGGASIVIDNYNTVVNNKPYIGLADDGKHPAIPGGKTGTFNFVIAINVLRNRGTNPSNYAPNDRKITELLQQKGGKVVVEYNGIELEIPVTFEGMRIDTTGKVACDAKIVLPSSVKGY
jgi:hypothetical protein